MDLNSKIFIAGGRGLVGSALIRCLKKKGYLNILAPLHAELELMDQKAVSDYFEKERPEYVFLAAAKVGGILANDTFSADFIYNNLMIQNSIIHQSFVHNVKKLLFLGSSCIYPRVCPQPIKEEYFMTGPLEPTNEAYAVAKIAGIEMCWAYNKQHGTSFIPVMPTNLYGPNDNFDLETSHVLPALIRKFHEAKKNKLESVVIWGTGKPKREFLYIDDLAAICIYIMQNADDILNNSTQISSEKPLINIGTGVDVTVAELAQTVKEVVGFSGKIEYDIDKPDGTPRKLLDISILKKSGCLPDVSLKSGIMQTYDWFVKDIEK